MQNVCIIDSNVCILGVNNIRSSNPFIDENHSNKNEESKYELTPEKKFSRCDELSLHQEQLTPITIHENGAVGTPRTTSLILQYQSLAKPLKLKKENGFDFNVCQVSIPENPKTFQQINENKFTYSDELI